ncbi:MAG: type IV pilus assembly protein PilM [Planctomycetota bacterium]|jgi:type IV pilus assembly protein PilM
MSSLWNRLFKDFNQEVLGLDIGSSSVKAVQLHRNHADYEVTAVANAAIPSSESEQQTDRNTVRAIKECFRSSGINSRLAICGGRGLEVAVRYFCFSNLPLEELRGAVTLEASQVCPFNINEAVVDYQLIGNGHESIRGVLVAATSRLIRHNKNLIRSASLTPVLMDIDGLALLNCFSEQSASEPGKTTAILNVGTAYTTLAIMSGNGLPFIRDIASGGSDIIEQIAQENSMSEDYVEDMLCTPGPKKQAAAELSESLTRASEALIADVAETLRYHTTQGRSAVVDKIYLCGGFALVRGFAELMSEYFKEEIVLWDPLSNIRSGGDLRTEDLIKSQGPRFAVAAGLAMRSI